MPYWDKFLDIQGQLVIIKFCSEDNYHGKGRPFECVQTSKKSQYKDKKTCVEND